MTSESAEDSLRKLCQHQTERLRALSASNDTQCQALIDADKRIKELKERLARAGKSMDRILAKACWTASRHYGKDSLDELEKFIRLELKAYDEGEC